MSVRPQMSENPQQRPGYVRQYGVSLLDDLHNYFPAVLYEPTSFSSVSDVLLYIQLQTRRQFDPFTVGSNQYSRRTAQRHVQETPFVRFTVREPPIAPIAPVASPALMALFLEALGAGAGGQRQADMTPVLVRPTAEQIGAATILHTVLGNAADLNNCAICQDQIQDGEVVRTIRQCRHYFHQTCIDTWFQQNVRCPTCRLDIREASTEEDAH